MGYWLVQHDIGAYWDRRNAVGSLKARALKHRNFRQIRQGDRIVYYSKRKRKVVPNILRAVDGADELEQDSQGRSHGVRDQTDR
jgi:hypothetical protein